MTAAPSDPLYAKQWYLQTINAPAVWEDYTGRGVNIGLFDFDGADYSHPDLVANANSALDFVYNGTTIDPGAIPSARSHGTALAGVTSGARNGIGIVGVAYDSKFTDVPLTYNNDGRNTDYIRAAMAYEAAFDVVNLSWTFAPYFMTGALYTAIHDGIVLAADTGRHGLGTAVVVAAGNDRNGQQTDQVSDVNAAGAQASDRHSIVVAGAGSDGVVADYSTQGANLLVAAPAQGHWNNTSLPGIFTTDRVGTDGFNTATTADGGDYVEAVGTSFAAPIVSGIIALMLEANPNLGWRDIKEILAISARHTGSAIPIGATPETLQGAETNTWTIDGAVDWNGGGMHFSNDYGFGLVDARAAVRLAETWKLQQTSSNESHQTATVNGAVTIPDNDPSGATTTFNMSSGVAVETVSVSLNISDSYVGDLVIWLTSPSGTTSMLSNRIGGSTDVNGWTYSSNAFMGEVSQGTWTLHLVDQAKNDVGTYSTATLDLYGFFNYSENT